MEKILWHYVCGNLASNDKRYVKFLFLSAHSLINVGNVAPDTIYVTLDNSLIEEKEIVILKKLGVKFIESPNNFFYSKGYGLEKLVQIDPSADKIVQIDCDTIISIENINEKIKNINGCLAINRSDDINTYSVLVGREGHPYSFHEKHFSLSPENKKAFENFSSLIYSTYGTDLNKWIEKTKEERNFYGYVFVLKPKELPKDFFKYLKFLDLFFSCDESCLSLVKFHFNLEFEHFNSLNIHPGTYDMKENLSFIPYDLDDFDKRKGIVHYPIKNNDVIKEMIKRSNNLVDQYNLKEINLRRTYTLREIEYKFDAPLVNDVYVGDQRVVFNNDWTINEAGSHHFLYWTCNVVFERYVEEKLSFSDKCEQLALEAKNRGIQELPDNTPYALCTHYWHGYPFGHWFETLASLRFVPGNDWKVLVNKTCNNVSTRDIDLHLELIGIDKERQVFFDWWGPTPHCKRLYCPSLDSHVGHLSNDACSWLREKYLSNPKVLDILDNKPRKLYLSRNYFTHPNPDWTRRVLNEEADVLPILEKNGFTILKGTEPLLDLINYFYSATHIVFPHGSMICYAIFCNNKPKIVEFMSEHRIRDDNIDLIVRNKITPKEKYKIILASGTNPITNDIKIDVEKLKKEIE